MTRSMRLLFLFLLFSSSFAMAQPASRVVDIPTRPGVTQRFLLITPPDARAAVVLMAGGHGGLQIQPDGSFGWGAGNFLVRSRQMFADQGLVVAVVDAPSDRQSEPYLQGFRQTAAHMTDLKAVVAWMRENTKVPVWLVGTSRGTQSVGFAATALQGADAPDGIVLTSTILSDPKGRPVPTMPLDQVKIPVLVVHHDQDACSHCNPSGLPWLMNKLTHASRKQLLTFSGGVTQGDPCEAMAYHGFNGIESEVVKQTAAWVLAK